MTSPARSSPIHILLVEDDANDADLTMRALRAGKIHNDVHVVRDGDSALAYLRRQGGAAAARMPDLILLDLDLPGTDGRAVLEVIKGDPALQHIPVIIVTGSTAEEDVVRSYRLHANAYVTKPIDPVKFLAVVNSIERFWLEFVKLPSR